MEVTVLGIKESCIPKHRSSCSLGGEQPSLGWWDAGTGWSLSFEAFQTTCPC